MNIEKGIPIPYFAGSATRYPWDEMDVGDSMFAPKPTSLASAATLAGKRRGWKFSARTVTENGVKGTRVWRIA